jgi:hypothetical protein
MILNCCYRFKTPENPKSVKRGYINKSVLILHRQLLYNERDDVPIMTVPLSSPVACLRCSSFEP